MGGSHQQGWENGRFEIKCRFSARAREQLKELTRVLGYDPEKVLVKEALIEPHRAVIEPEQQIETLRTNLKQMLRKELLDMK